MIEVAQTPDDYEARAAKLRSRVFAAADEFIRDCSVPLVAEGVQANRHASGVLIQIAEYKFLVTVAHFIKPHLEAERIVCMVRPGKGNRAVRLLTETFYSTVNDDVDLSFCELEPITLSILGDEVKFARISNMISKKDRRHDQGRYLILGFPFDIIGPDEDGDERITTWNYISLPFDGDYGTVTRFDPSLHLVLTYERRTHNEEGAKVPPPGMSGCGIWWISHQGPDEIINKDNFKLVAIQNAWHRGEEYAIGTWIDEALLIIWRYCPKVRDAMRIHGVDFG